MQVYPVERLYEEVAFVAYHFNWGHDAVLNMPHWERQRWCEEISAINERINDESARAGPGTGPGGGFQSGGRSDSGSSPVLEQEIPDEFFEEDASE